MTGQPIPRQGSPAWFVSIIVPSDGVFESNILSKPTLEGCYRFAVEGKQISIRMDLLRCQSYMAIAAAKRTAQIAPSS